MGSALLDGAVIGGEERHCGLAAAANTCGGHRLCL